MAKALSLIGQRFGYLTVVERAENNSRNNTCWQCKCDCGNNKVALGYDLTHGRIVECGCGISKRGKASKKRIDLTGMVFGELTVVSINESRGSQGALRWDCQCSCGNMITVQGSNLKSGKTWHCGCKKSIYAHNRIDLTGERRGLLTVLRESPSKGKIAMWECECACGVRVIKSSSYLKNSKNPSCGCANIEISRNNLKIANSRPNKRGTSHGMSGSRIYKEWTSMKNRCKPNYHNHNSYYDIGVIVCEELRKFENFMKWALDAGYDDALSLDRINVYGIYEPSNCRWITMKEQQNNRRDNIYIKREDETRTLKQWCDALKLPYRTILARHRNGWSEERLFDAVQTRRK